MSVGSNIRLRRIELGLSQQDLADRLGYKTKSTIAKIESGANDITLNKLEEFAKILDTSVSSLVSNTNNSFEITTPQNKSKKTIAVILAGGKSTRNNQNIPNQFINVLGKPIIIYAMESYEKYPSIDDIYVVCLKGWESILKSYISQYNISKFRGIIPAGKTGILSCKNAIIYLTDICNQNDTIIFQESTRPLVNENNISKLLLEYDKKGSAITSGSMSEHLQFFNDGTGTKYINRNFLFELQSPEAHKYKDLQSLFNHADSLNHTYTESCIGMLMYNLGKMPNLFEGNLSNIKIIRQEDIVIFEALIR